MREPCGRSVSGMDTWHGRRREEGSSGGSGRGEAGGTGDHEREASKSTVVFISRTTVTDLESAWGACI